MEELAEQCRRELYERTIIARVYINLEIEIFERSALSHHRICGSSLTDGCRSWRQLHPPD